MTRTPRVVLRVANWALPRPSPRETIQSFLDIFFSPLIFREIERVGKERRRYEMQRGMKEKKEREETGKMTDS
jgi:hypothetical protein